MVGVRFSPQHEQQPDFADFADFGRKTLSNMAFPIVLLPKKKELKLMPDTSRDELQAKIYDSCQALITTINAVNAVLRKLDGKAYQFSAAWRNWRTLRWRKLFCGRHGRSRRAGEPRWMKSIRVKCTILETYQRGFWADHTRSGEQAEFTAAVCALFAEYVSNVTGIQPVMLITATEHESFLTSWRRSE